MITAASPDRQKALALKSMAETTYKRLLETDMEKYPANTLTDYYDAIHKIIEAITVLRGIKFKGDGAHVQLIDYLGKENIIDENMRVFLQEMREYRNRIHYEGFNLHLNYIKLNKEKIEQILAHLQQQLKKDVIAP